MTFGESDHEFPSAFSSRNEIEPYRCRAANATPFATTDLEKTQRLNLNVIGVNGLLTLRVCRLCCLSGLIRLGTIERKLNFKLNKIKSVFISWKV